MSKNYNKILRQLEQQLINLIQSMLKKGASERDIKLAVKKYIKEFNPYKRLSKQFATDAETAAESAFKSAEKRLFWIAKHTRPKLNVKALNVLVVANNQFATLAGKINKNVVKAVETAIKNDLTRNELTKLIQDSVSGTRYQARTIANTSLQGFSSANKLQLETDAGIEKWKYSGVPAQRLFCQERLGKTYTKKQIEAMENGHGLPVLYYSGGYNCPHEWEAVIDDELLIKLGVKK